MSKKILSVDDSTSVRKLVEFSLKSKGYTVVSAEDGQEGWEILQQETFDVAVLDINMPRLDGLELLKKIRADQRLTALPVIMLTTEGHNEDKEQAQKIGATDYLVKPFKPTELIQAIGKLL